MKSSTRAQHPCRKVVFRIKAHDQGWGGNQKDKGTYKGSKTWFDTGLESIEVDPERKHSYWFNMPYGVNALNVDNSALEETFIKEGADVPCILRTHCPCGDRDELWRTPEGQVMQNRYYDHPFEPHVATLQINKLATRETQEHVIEWRYNDDVGEQELKVKGRGESTGDGSFVRNLKVGDVVTLWARARYGGWVNDVSEVTMEVYWAV